MLLQGDGAGPHRGDGGAGQAQARRRDHAGAAARRPTSRPSPPPSKAQGKFKRQTGGHGQFGDAHVELSPLPRGAGFEFEDAIVGGSIPRQFIPSVEKGIRGSLGSGPAGRLPGGRLQGQAGLRQLPRRRQLRHGLPGGRLDGLQEGHGRGPAHPARAGHAARGAGAGGVRRRGHGRPQHPPRPGAGHGAGRPRRHHPGHLPARRGHDLRRRPPLADPGASATSP